MSVVMNRDRLLALLAAAVFLIFFNGYMVAPLLIELAREFAVSVEKMGYVLPAYLLIYGFSTLFYGPLSDRIGRVKILIVLIFLFAVVTFLTAFAPSYESLLALRALAGLCAGGILPVVLALIGDLYPYEQLGVPMGWIFGSVAGGIAFGAAFGTWLNHYIGWRREFMILAVAIGMISLLVWKIRKSLPATKTESKPLMDVFHGYVSILSKARSQKTYLVIFLNGVFHSGVFSWLGFYLTKRYGLGDAQIGQALLGYGIPGMLLGPFIGRLADRFGRRFIIPIGLWVAALCALILAPVISLWVAIAAITVLSAGYDMTQPLLAGIVTSLDPKRRGQAIGLNAFMLFTGFGFGSLIFQFCMQMGLGAALVSFTIFQALLGIFALRAFRDERVKAKRSSESESLPDPHGMVQNQESGKS